VTLTRIHRYALDELRRARAAALGDAEGFPEILYTLERIGTALSGRVATLDAYKRYIQEIANASALSAELTPQQRHGHTEFDRLYDVVRAARNEAMHHGVFARHLTRHAVELCLLLEDGLMSNATIVADFMVRDPVCAQLWQPLSLIRQQMLANSFSYLPVPLDNGSYGLLADVAVARALANSSSNGDRRRTLACSLDESVAKGRIEITRGNTIGPEEEVRAALERCDGKPLLVVDEEKRLLGIVTPFDML
jgi:CBS-domain-containing membrane protein